MKFAALLLAASLPLLTGCEYEAPLAPEQGLPIDPAVLGLWEPVPEEGEEPKPEERMMILQLSGTEYLIHHPAGKDGIYYRGYPLQVGGAACVQLQVLGTGEGPPQQDAAELFHVAAYSLTNGRMTVTTLNRERVDDDLKTTAELQASFLQHKNDGDLFKNPGVFRRCAR